MISNPDHIKSKAFLDAVQIVLDPDLKIDSPMVSLALETWRRLRGDRDMPAPSDIDPVELPRQLLPHMLLLDIEHDPALRFRWRLIGTHITGVLNRDRTGRYWDGIYDQRTFSALSVGPLWVLEHRRPVRTIGSAHYVGKDFIRSESIDLPLSADGRTVSRMLVVTQYSVV